MILKTTLRYALYNMDMKSVKILGNFFLKFKEKKEKRGRAFFKLLILKSKILKYIIPF